MSRNFANAWTSTWSPLMRQTRPAAWACRGAPPGRRARGGGRGVPPALGCPARSGVERAERGGGERVDATRAGIRGALGTASSARDVEPAGAEPGRCPDLDGISSRRPASVTRRGAFAWSSGAGGERRGAERGRGQEGVGQLPTANQRNQLQRIAALGVVGHHQFSAGLHGTLYPQRIETVNGYAEAFLT